MAQTSSWKIFQVNNRDKVKLQTDHNGKLKIAKVMFNGNEQNVYFLDPKARLLPAAQAQDTNRTLVETNDVKQPYKLTPQPVVLPTASTPSPPDPSVPPSTSSAFSTASSEAETITVPSTQDLINFDEKLELSAAPTSPTSQIPLSLAASVGLDYERDYIKTMQTTATTSSTEPTVANAASSKPTFKEKIMLHIKQEKKLDEAAMEAATSLKKQTESLIEKGEIDKAAIEVATYIVSTIKERRDWDFKTDGGYIFWYQTPSQTPFPYFMNDVTGLLADIKEDGTRENIIKLLQLQEIKKKSAENEEMIDSIIEKRIGLDYVNQLRVVKDKEGTYKWDGLYPPSDKNFKDLNDLGLIKKVEEIKESKDLKSLLKICLQNMIGGRGKKSTNRTRRRAPLPTRRREYSRTQRSSPTPFLLHRARNHKKTTLSSRSRGSY
jgi:hypothetical protein